MTYHLVQGLAVIKDTDNFCLGKHKTVIRDIVILSLISKANSPGKSVKHSFSEASRMEDRHAETLIDPERLMCRSLCFHSKVYTRVDMIVSNPHYPMSSF